MNFSYSETNKLSPESFTEHTESLRQYQAYLTSLTEILDTQAPETSITLPLNRNYVSTIKDFAKKHNSPRLGAIVVVGIGGSNLGTWALYNSLAQIKRPIIFAETTDPSSIIDIVSELEHIYAHNQHVTLIVVSKSGQTTETIANYGVLIQALKDYDKDWQNHIIAITDEYSKLFDYANKYSFDVLTIPQHVGGRYSVFSAVGLFPLLLAGASIDDLLDGAEEAVMDNVSSDLKKNTSLASAASIYGNYLNGKTIHNTFIFDSSLYVFGKWYRQLVAESLGKDGKGITPITSVGSTDLHSVAQLYFAGPHDKFTTFITVKNTLYDAQVSNNVNLDDLVPHIAGKRLSEIMNAIYKGVTVSYKKNDLPFVEIQLESLNEYACGYLLQTKMIETMYLAKLMNVNAFNQPNVEEYKIETNAILKGS